VRHRAGPVVERILEGREAVVETRRPDVALTRHLHAEGLMRAFVMEAVDEGVEPGLLLQRIGRRGLRGFGLQREMHALVPPVLFGMSGPNAFDLNA
jgi:hypothetical protein